MCCGSCPGEVEEDDLINISYDLEALHYEQLHQEYEALKQRDDLQ